MPVPHIDVSMLQEWLAHNPAWVAAAIALISFTESFAIVGIVVPGVALLGAAAFVAGTGALSLPACLVAAFSGAVLGDGISFLLGRRYRHGIKQVWPLHRHPEWIAGSERFFESHGMMSVAIGRFVGPIRPMIPLVAGMLGMQATHFFLVNVLSALVWAPVYIAPGYFLGAAVQTRLAAPELVAGVIVSLLGAGVVLWWARRRGRI